MNRPLPVALLAAIVLAPASSGCKDQAKESAARATHDVAATADLVAKDVGEVARGLPAGAKVLSTLVADGADPRQDVAGVRKALLRVRRDDGRVLPVIAGTLSEAD